MAITLKKIQMMKDDSQVTSQFWIIMVELFQISNPDSAGVNNSATLQFQNEPRIFFDKLHKFQEL